MERIRAYTLMEVTVAMLISAICIIICYTGYGIITSYYSAFQQKNGKADTLLSLRKVLDRDFLKSRWVLHTEQGLLLQHDSLEITYIFEKEKIIRKHQGLRADTFKLVYTAPYLSFAGTEVLELDTIDFLRFKVALDSETEVPLNFYKHYSAQELFH